MRLRDHLDINWERWLRPVDDHTGSGLASLAHATLKGVLHSPKAYGTPASLELTLDYGGKSIVVSHVFSDRTFARRLHQELKQHCLEKTLQEIGERTAP